VRDLNLDLFTICGDDTPANLAVVEPDGLADLDSVEDFWQCARNVR